MKKCSICKGKGRYWNRSAIIFKFTKSLLFFLAWVAGFEVCLVANFSTVSVKELGLIFIFCSPIAVIAAIFTTGEWVHMYKALLDMPCLKCHTYTSRKYY